MQSKTKYWLAVIGLVNALAISTTFIIFFFTAYLQPSNALIFEIGQAEKHIEAVYLAGSIPLMLYSFVWVSRQ